MGLWGNNNKERVRGYDKNVRGENVKMGNAKGVK